MSLEYIREHYAVPAFKGARVRYRKMIGTITGFDGPHILVRLDGERAEHPYHPTDVVYLERELDKLIIAIEEIVPYVKATLNPGSSVTTSSNKEWIAVHRGRASSSCNQLEGLLKRAKEIKQ